MDRIDKIDEMTAEQAQYYRMAIRDCWQFLFDKEMYLLVPANVESKVNTLENRVIKRLVKLKKLPRYHKCDDPKCQYPAQRDHSKCCEEEKKQIRTRVLKKRDRHEMTLLHSNKKRVVA